MSYLNDFPHTTLYDGDLRMLIHMMKKLKHQMDELKEDYEKFKNEMIKENEEFKNEVTQLLDEKIKEIDEKIHELDLLVSNLQLQWNSFRDFINQNITAQNEKIDQLHELIKVIQNDLELIHNVIDKLDKFMKDYENLLSRVDMIESDVIEAKNNLELHIKDFNDFKASDEEFHNETNLNFNDIQSQITVINDTISNIDINSITEKLTEIENTVNDLSNKVNSIDDLLSQVEEIENEITLLTEKTNKIDDLEGHLTTVENEIGDISQIDPYTNIVDNLINLNNSSGVSPFEGIPNNEFLRLTKKIYINTGSLLDGVLSYVDLTISGSFPDGQFLRGGVILKEDNQLIEYLNDNYVYLSSSVMYLGSATDPYHNLKACSFITDYNGTEPAIAWIVTKGNETISQYNFMVRLVFVAKNLYVKPIGTLSNR